MPAGATTRDAQDTWHGTWEGTSQGTWEGTPQGTPQGRFAARRRASPFSPNTTIKSGTHLGRAMAPAGDGLKVYVVDNGGQWTHREWRVLKYLGAETKMVANDTSWEDLAKEDLDGIVLSGGAPRVGVEGDLGKCGEILENAEIPVLGICAGLQYMARFFGGDAAPGGSEFGATELTVIAHEDPDVLKDVPETSQVFESHHDEVSVVPDCFEVIARSELCGVQVMRHRERPIFGMQFHPEVEGSEFGVKMFENFLDVCRANKAAREGTAVSATNGA